MCTYQMTRLSLLAAAFLVLPQPAMASRRAAVTTLKVSPASAQVRLNAAQTFTESGITVTPTMLWQLVSTAPNSKPDASGALGKIDSSGHYVAPSSLPSPNTVLVQFIDTASPSTVASATVTLQNPLPVIASLTPNSMNVGLASTVVIAGTGFLPASILQFGGQPVPPAKYVVKSTTEIDYTDTPSAASQQQVTVVNPNPGGATSNGKTLTIGSAVSVTLNPNNKTIRGGVALALSATVHNNSNQNVTWTVNGVTNGNSTVGAISTDSKGVVSYTAPWVIPAAATVTIVATSVAAPSASASITVTLQNPVPVIQSVSPSSLVIDSTVPITITGQGFATGAIAYLGGIALTTTVVSNTTLTATATVAAVGPRQIALKVTNPNPGTATSSPFVIPQTVANNCTANGSPSVCMPFADAVRFLEMATWGASPASIAHLQEIGRDAWLKEQFAMAPSAWTLANSLTEGPSRIQTVFFNLALMSTDQLRQRVAFALSEIFVVSATKDTTYEAMRDYINDLSTNAFGTYRQLLGVMTLNPAMGWFLDMVNNDKANPANNTVANENYARESMQLFSIGLSVLNPDGTPTPTAAYPADTVSELAKVFTGWTYPAIPDTASHWTNAMYFDGPMMAFEDHHDTTQKQLVFTGQPTCTIAAGGTAQIDLDAALDCIANHPNVAPFISYRLIQRLVKSNPTPQYVQDIATVFNNTQGNLQQVVTAILTHSEATTDGGSGKLREPVLYATSLLRALNATVTTNAGGVANQSTLMGQQVLYAPSVFSYFSPFYRVPVFGVVAPEFQGLNVASGLARLNYAYAVVNNQVSGNIKIDITKFQDLADNATDLVNAINQALYHGEMPAVLQQNLIAIAGEVAKETSDVPTLVRTLLYFAAGAPQYQVQQ
jgi:uncharacterized protein (DUF1800 family)